jgi:hypothetical protein
MGGALAFALCAVGNAPVYQNNPGPELGSGMGVAGVL